MRVSSSFASLLAIALTAGVAAAQPEEEITLEQHMEVPMGRVLVHAFTEIGLADGQELDQVSIAPDVWLGLTDELTVGIVHSGRGTTGIYGSVGNGVCVTGDDGALGHCEDVYTNGGIAGRYRFYRDPTDVFSASVEAGLFAGPFDPFTSAGKIGFITRFETPGVALEIGPNLFFGLSEREPTIDNEAMFTANKETLNIPVTALIGVTDVAGLALQVGASMPVEEASAQYRLGASAGAFVSVTNRVMVEAMFSLPALARGSDFDIDMTDELDARTLTVGLGATL